MPEGHVLEFASVTKRFGAVTAVSDFSARIEPGVVTGFLGPNGAGKTTTLRILLGLLRADEGSATIGGQAYAKLREPLHTVGAVLEASSFHPGRTAANHLRVYARAASISNARVDDVLGLVGLADAAGRKVGGFSLGMRQRLGVAYALLGDPGVLVLDEPSNGLDPEGIRWMRGFLRQLAREGRTVLVSSHLLTEIQQTVDALVVIAQGRLVFQGGLEELVDPSEYTTVADAPDRAALTTALAHAEIPYEVLRSGITVRGFEPVAVGQAAADAGVVLSTLQRRGPALEEVFLELVSGARVHESATRIAPPAVVAEPVAATAPVAEPTDVPASTVDAAGPAAAAGIALGGTSWDELVRGETPSDTPSVVDDSDAADATDAPIEALPAAEDAGTVEPQVDAETQNAEDPSDPDTESESESESETIADPGTAADEDDEHDAEDLPAPRPAFAVASTGIIDIVPAATPADPPEDADPDVEALGEIDDELSAPDAIDADADAAAASDETRPFDTYDKTDADIDADSFFAAFDDGTGPAVDPQTTEGGDER